VYRSDVIITEHVLTAICTVHVGSIMTTRLLAIADGDVTTLSTRHVSVRERTVSIVQPRPHICAFSTEILRKNVAANV